MKRTIAALIFIVGFILAMYVGVWVMFVRHIMDCAKAYDAGTLTATMVGFALVKCAFASAVTSILIAFATSIAQIIGR